MIGFDSMIKKYGREISLHLPDGWSSTTYRAFIQPLRYKNKMYLEGEQTPIGLEDPSTYLYIGPVAHNLCALSPTAWMEDGDGEKYRIVKAEKVHVSNRAVYIWAVIRVIEEAAYERYQ